MARNLNPTARLEKESAAWALAEKGYTQRRIADELGVSQPTVCAMLHRAADRWMREQGEQIARIKAMQTVQLCHLFDEAVQAYKASKAPKRKAYTHEVAREIKTKNAKGEPITKRGKIVKTTHQEVTDRPEGNGHFLTLARSLAADVARMWGLDRYGSDEQSPDDVVPLAQLVADLKAADDSYAQRRPALAGPSRELPMGHEPIQQRDPGPG